MALVLLIRRLLRAMAVMFHPSFSSFNASSRTDRTTASGPWKWLWCNCMTNETGSGVPTAAMKPIRVCCDVSYLFQLDEWAVVGGGGDGRGE